MTTKYQIGDKIAYRAFGGELRVVVVDSKSANIKNDRPGFDAHMVDDPDEFVWGYDDQIERIY